MVPSDQALTAGNMLQESFVGGTRTRTFPQCREGPSYSYLFAPITSQSPTLIVSLSLLQTPILIVSPGFSHGPLYSLQLRVLPLTTPPLPSPLSPPLCDCVLPSSPLSFPPPTSLPLPAQNVSCHAHSERALTRACDCAPPT